MTLGTLYLGGGGSPEDEQALWQRMLNGLPRVLYWPFALPTSMLADASDWLAAGLAGYDFTGTLETWTTLDGHDHTELYDFDLVFVGGGNTFQLLHEIRSHGFLEPVRRFVQSGGTYYGGSAGAIVACDDISIAQWHDPNDVGLSDLQSLGLVHDIAVLPHYQTADDGAAAQWAQRHPARLVCLPERTGLIVTPARTLVVGQEPAWTYDGERMQPHPPGTVLPDRH